MQASGCHLRRGPCLLNRWAGLLFVGWLAAVCAGFGVLSEYAAAPGAVGAVPASWPPATALDRSPNSARLLVFIHPRCPCTRATVAELARLLAQVHSPCAATAVIFAPQGAAADWTDTFVCDAAAAIPGLEITADPGGVEARHFGATTSGQVLLYSSRGELLFCGGITPARGHEGDSAGRDAVLSALAAGRTQAGTPVFGCALVESCGETVENDTCPQPMP